MIYRNFRAVWSNSAASASMSGVSCRFPDNPRTRANGRAHLQLYRRTWTNPTPEVEITSIDFISAMTACAPFLIALAVDDVAPEQVPASLKPGTTQK